MAMQRAYGVGGSPFVDVFPPPIVTNMNPTAGDIADIGQTWINTLLNAEYVLTSIHLGQAVWTLSSNNGAGVFDSLEVIPGRVFINSEVGVEIDVLGGTGISLDADTTSNFSVEGAGSDLNLASGDGAVNIDAGAGISLDAASASNFTVTGAGTLSLGTTGIGAVTVSSSATGNVVLAALGTGDNLISANTGNVNISSNFNTPQCITIESNPPGAGNAAGIRVRNVKGTSASAILLDAQAGGVTLNAAGAVTLNAVSSSSFHVTGAAQNAVVQSDSGVAGIVSDANIAGATQVAARTGIASTLVVQNVNSTLANAIDVDSLAGGVTIDAAGAISLDAVSTSNFSVSGAAQNLNFVSALGTVGSVSSANIAGAISIVAQTGNANTLLIQNTNSAAVNAVDVNAIAGGVTIDAASSVDLNAVSSSTFTVSGAAQNLILGSTLGTVSLISSSNIVASTQVIANTGDANTILIQNTASLATNAVDINATVGGIDIDSSKGVIINSAVESITLKSATAAVGTGLLLNQGTQTAGIYVGTGDPTLAAVAGSLYIKTDATTAVTRLWIRTDGGAWAFFTASA